VKILKQETDRSCGIACIRSIMNSLGSNLSEKDVWDKHEPYFQSPNSMLNPMLNFGITSLKFGFDVEYYNYHPVLANNNQDSNLKKSLEIKSKNYFQFGKYYVDRALEFLNLSGKIIFDKLGVDRIKEIIDENKFVVVEIMPAFVNKNLSLNMRHKVIVSGYTEKEFKILDPSDAREHIWNCDTFLLAFYSAIPEMLVISKKG
jgi:hypothetical protein